MKLEFYFRQSEWSACTDVYIVGIKHTGERFIAEPMDLNFTPHDPSKEREPSLRFTAERSMGFFPALVEGLARAGFRYESKEVGELKATKDHLEDMRKLVFK